MVTGIGKYLEERALGFVAFSVILVVVSIAGCRTVTVDSNRDGLVKLPPKDSPDEVELIKTGIPDPPHRIIGTVRAKVKLSPYQDRTWPDDRVLRKMVSEGMKLGADALINFEVQPRKGGGNYLSPPGTVLTGDSQIWIATAIVWTY